jgi:TRAP-type C4-dicarboxylate transport system substrate-binding protein
MKSTILKSALSGTFSLLLGSLACAQGAPTLRIADSLPAGFPMIRYSTGHFIERMEKSMPSAIKFAHFPAEQLGKSRDLLSLTQSGIVDIGYVVPALISDKLPLSAIGDLPGAAGSACQGVMAYWTLVRPGGLLDKEEFQPLGLRVLYVAGNPPYQVFTRNKVLNSPDDLKGLKIRAPSGGQAIIMRRLGAVPVNIPGSEMYESLSRGTVDGLLFPVPGVLGYDLGGLLKNMSVGQNFGNVMNMHVISLKKWNTLPEAVRKAMDEAGEAATRNVCARLDEDTAKDTETLKSKGLAVNAWSESDRQRVAEMRESVGDQWAADLDKRGKPGSVVLKAFRSALEDTQKR